MTDSWGASFPQDSKLPDEKTRQYLTAGAPVSFEALRAPVSQPAPQPASQPHDRLVLSTLCLSGPLWASLCVYICASPRHFGLLWASLGLWLQITTAYFRGTSREQARCNLHRHTHICVHMFVHTQRLFSSAPAMYIRTPRRGVSSAGVQTYIWCIKRSLRLQCRSSSRDVLRVFTSETEVYQSSPWGGCSSIVRQRDSFLRFRRHQRRNRENDPNSRS